MSEFNISELLSKVDGISPLVDAKVLTSRDKVRTPVDLLNDLLGGGIPFGTIAGIYGPPGGGKSTLAYLIAAEFLREFPNGVTVVIDIEQSADPVRMKSLGIDIDKVFRIVPTSINDGFNQLITFINNVIDIEESSKGKVKIPIVVIWDTISKGRAEEGETASRMDARNRARVIKSRMNDLIPLVEKVDMIVFPLNQVIVEVDRYGNAKNNAGGGVGLAHDEHLRLYIQKKASDYDQTTGLMLSERSEISMDKSKVSPAIRGISMVLDSTLGGRVDSIKSLVFFYYERGWLKITGRRYELHWVIERAKEMNTPYAKYLEDYHGKTYSYNQWVDRVLNDPALKIILELFFIDEVGDKYQLQREVMSSYREVLAKQLVEINSEAYVLSIDTEEDVEGSEESTTEGGES